MRERGGTLPGAARGCKLRLRLGIARRYCGSRGVVPTPSDQAAQLAGVGWTVASDGHRAPTSGDQVNRAGLIAALVQRAALSRGDAARVVEALFGTSGIITSALRRGERVQITGFGSFQLRARGARLGRDPRTGKTIQIGAAVAPLFRAGAALKAALNRQVQLRE